MQTVNKTPVSAWIACLLFIGYFVTSITWAQVTTEGSIDFHKRVELKSLVKGTVSAIHAEVGQRIVAGAVVVELDPTSQQAKLTIADAQVKQRQIELDVAEAFFERQNELFDRGSLSLTMYDEAQNAVLVARAKMAEARARHALARHQLVLTKLRAPFDAIVLSVNVHSDSRVHPDWQVNRSLAVLASDGDYVARFEVPVSERKRLVSAGKANISVEGKVYPAMVTVPSLDPVTSDSIFTYPVYLRFTEKKSVLLPGSRAVLLF